MKFAIIDYLNVLPFTVFLKKQPFQNSFKAGALRRKNKPSALNARLLSRRIDAALVSSIVAKNRPFVQMGIVADRQVQSVLLLSGEPKTDAASQSSNALARVLGLEGEVMIGDRALRYFCENPNGDFLDLASVWHRQTGLPFVFALLSYNKNGYFYEMVAKKFLRSKQKIPHSVRTQEATKRGLGVRQLDAYLRLIRYDVGKKELQSLRKFWLAAKK